MDNRLEFLEWLVDNEIVPMEHDCGVRECWRDACEMVNMGAGADLDEE